MLSSKLGYRRRCQYCGMLLTHTKPYVLEKNLARHERICRHNHALIPGLPQFNKEIPLGVALLERRRRR